MTGTAQAAVTPLPSRRHACNFMDRPILAILKRAIKHDLGFSDTQLGALSGLAFTLFYTMLGVPQAHALPWARQQYSRA